MKEQKPADIKTEPRSQNTPTEIEDADANDHFVTLGGFEELTAGAGRQYVDGRKDSERQ